MSFLFPVDYFRARFYGTDRQYPYRKLPEGVYLATSDDVQGLIAQGRTVAETIEIARDVARKLVEEQASSSIHALPVAENLDYPVVIGS